MGHDVLYCKFCDSPVMEGHNDWECDCGASCNSSTQYKWVQSSKSNSSYDFTAHIKKMQAYEKELAKKYGGYVF